MNRLLALAALAAACASVPPARRAEEKIARAQKLKSDHRLEASYEAYADAVELDPANTAAIRGWVEAAEKLHRLPQLEGRFAARVKASPDDAFAHFGLGLAIAPQDNEARLKEAEPPLFKAAQLSPRTGDLWFRHGLVASKLGLDEKALASFGKAAALEPEKPLGRIAYGHALAKAGRASQAAHELGKLLTLSPSRADLMFARSVSRELERSYRALPEPAKLRLTTALELVKKDAVADARPMLDELRTLFPETGVIVTALAMCELQSGHTAEAVTGLQQAAAMAPDAAEPLLLLADLYRSRDHVEEARPLYEKGLALDPLRPEAWKALAELATAERQPAAALSRYANYVLLAPDDLPTRLLYLGLLESTPGQDAGPAWDLLLVDFPKSPEALIGRARWHFGTALAAAGRDRKAAAARARRDLDVLLVLDPENQAAPPLRAEVDKLQ